MRRRLLWALIALNLLLAITLIARITPGGAGENAALAQVRRPADYIMIPGEVNGGSTAVVYVIDTSNGLLGAMAYDDSAQRLDTMPPLDLSRVFEIGGPPPNRGAGGPPPVAPRR